ncbi:hypothetical protein [Zunongwangia profunda]|uniref:hypothetical protein n=1 Tax=Zunongwangia profunda TaxID=398743 RepID=UPI0030D6DC38
MISKYKLNARIYPTLILLLPVLILSIYFSIDYESIYTAIGGLGFFALLQFVFSEVGRDRGKKAEKKLWLEWGGTPSTQILRHSDNTFDPHTTNHLHKRLCESTGIGHIDMGEIEKYNPDEADNIYSAWCGYLRGVTRDTSKYKLLFQENISYGFRRNLWGLKKPAIIFIAIVAAVIAFAEYLQIQANGTSPSLISALCFIGLLLILLFWLLIVNKSWIKSVAFAYAERLVEAVNS